MLLLCFSLSLLGQRILSLAMSHLQWCVFYVLFAQQADTLALPHNQCLTDPWNILHVCVYSDASWL